MLGRKTRETPIYGRIKTGSFCDSSLELCFGVRDLISLREGECLDGRLLISSLRSDPSSGKRLDLVEKHTHRLQIKLDSDLGTSSVSICSKDNYVLALKYFSDLFDENLSFYQRFLQLMQFQPKSFSEKYSFGDSISPYLMDKPELNPDLNIKLLDPISLYFIRRRFQSEIKKAD